MLERTSKSIPNIADSHGKCSRQTSKNHEKVRQGVVCCLEQSMSLCKQASLFGGELEPDQDESKYSTKIEAPVYQPSEKKPHLRELVDLSKTNSLIREIIASDIEQDVKQFLMEAAYRHAVFNYEKIADYYSHASPEVQALMEKSALVIIDFGKAIQHGYVKLCDEIKSQYLEES